MFVFIFSSPRILVSVTITSSVFFPISYTLDLEVVLGTLSFYLALAVYNIGRNNERK